MVNGGLPPAFRKGAFDYIFAKYPDEAAIDVFINTKLDYVNFDDEEYEFYLYESTIENREKRLTIPIEQNSIYQAIKNYCLEHDISDKLYDMLQYPDETIENIMYYSEDKNGHSFLTDLFGDDDTIDKTNIVNALHWEE